MPLDRAALSRPSDNLKHLSVSQLFLQMLLMQTHISQNYKT